MKVFVIENFLYSFFLIYSFIILLTVTVKLNYSHGMDHFSTIPKHSIKLEGANLIELVKTLELVLNFVSSLVYTLSGEGREAVTLPSPICWIDHFWVHVKGIPTGNSYRSLNQSDCNSLKIFRALSIRSINCSLVITSKTHHRLRIARLETLALND